MKTYVFDIDGTICTNTNGEYENAEPFINNIYKIAINSGALGGKLLGAGGGGFLLFYIKSENLRILKKKLNKFTFVDFNLTNNCSEIIYEI